MKLLIEETRSEPWLQTEASTAKNLKMNQDKKRKRNKKIMTRKNKCLRKIGPRKIKCLAKWNKKLGKSLTDT